MSSRRPLLESLGCEQQLWGGLYSGLLPAYKAEPKGGGATPHQASVWRRSQCTRQHDLLTLSSTGQHPNHHPAHGAEHGSYLVMLLTNFLSSTTTLSWQARGANTCRGSGNRGSFSPGAAAKMMALLRVCATPYCPACSRGRGLALGSVCPVGLFAESRAGQRQHGSATHQMASSKATPFAQLPS